jgi:CubicO group peptidase (beta-lactamase class C family)
MISPRPFARILCCISALLLLAGCMRIARHDAARAKVASRSVVVPGAESVAEQVRAELESMVREGVPGVTAIVMRDGKTLFRVDVGDIGPATPYPVASASKWMAAALLLTVVDEGKLALDEAISNVLPGFRGVAGRITLRQLLSHTAGVGSLKSRVDARQDPRITLAQSAAEIARRPLEDPPGEVFKYGGPGFQVAGALAEAVTGRRWADLFEERIAGPLGMTHTHWEHLPGRGISPAETLNPLLQGGVVTTADDYMRFLTMVAQRGLFAGRRILSEEAVDAMETAQTLGIPMAYLPPGAKPGMQYALGNWCERWNDAGRCSLVSSPGALGTYPWIDRQSGIYGIFFLRDRFTRVSGRLTKARSSIIGK